MVRCPAECAASSAALATPSIILANEVVKRGTFPERAKGDENFGPVVVVVPFSTDDEAIALNNDTEYGLSSGISWETAKILSERGPVARSGSILLRRAIRLGVTA